MTYYINKTTNYNFDEAVDKITLALKEQGFGIITEIDMKNTLKNKLNVDIRKYKILGACNPQFAHKALQEEEKIGILLPCNVTISEQENGKVDVAVMDPAVAMSVVDNKKMGPLANEVKERLQKALAAI